MLNICSSKSTIYTIFCRYCSYCLASPLFTDGERWWFSCFTCMNKKRSNMDLLRISYSKICTKKNFPLRAPTHQFRYFCQLKQKHPDTPLLSDAVSQYCRHTWFASEISQKTYQHNNFRVYRMGFESRGGPFVSWHGDGGRESL